MKKYRQAPKKHHQTKDEDGRKNPKTHKIEEINAFDDVCVTYRLPGEFQILYLNNEVDIVTPIIEPWFQVKNTGTSTIDWEDITIRYW